MPKPSSLQWQRWCPRRASIPTGARHETSPPNTIYRPVGSRGVAMKSRTTVSPREAWTGPLAAESCDAMPWDSARPCHPLVAIHVGLLGRSASPVQSQAHWTDIPRILSPFGRGCVLFLGIGVLQPRPRSSVTSISSFGETEMQAFIRRFLMYYGIYRRYPLGRLPSLRNAWRITRDGSAAPLRS